MLPNEPDTIHFFVSYAKADTQELAFALAKALNAPPYMTSWVDGKLKATDETWSRQIEREIKRCKYMIVLLSPDVNRPEDHPKGESFVLTEIRYMKESRKLFKHIIPVMAKPTDVPFDLTGKQYISYSGDLNALVEEICHKQIERPTPSEWFAEHRVSEQPTSTGAIKGSPQTDVAPSQSFTVLAKARQPLRSPVILSLAGLVIILVVLGGIAFTIYNGQLAQPATQTLHPTTQPTLAATSVPTLSISSTAAPTGGATAALIQANTDWTPKVQSFGGADMVFVPVGCFMMGSDTGNADEMPVHKVCFESPFWIDKFEVTNTVFDKSGGSAASKSDRTEPDQPREHVTWNEAQDLCKKRGLRLPTEAEWEYTARGSSNWQYPWGNLFAAADVVYGDNSEGKPATVGSKPGGKSWTDALDMSGNVWEWVADWYGPYPNQPENNPQGPQNESFKVLRGGSWLFDTKDKMRSAVRSKSDPSSASNAWGFRCAKSAG